LNSGLFLSIDAGTTNLKAGVVDPRGRIIATAERRMRLIRDAQGRAEHDPEELWRAAAEAGRTAVRGRAGRVEAVVLSSYQMGLVALDARMRPLTGMATILDARPRAAFGSLLRRPGMRALYRRTGTPPFALSPLARLHWLRTAHYPLFHRAAWFLGSKDWLLWRMTGILAAEMSVASATGLLDFRAAKWDEMALDLAGVDGRRLPPVVSGDRVIGRLNARAARELGLARGVPVVPGLYDGGTLAVGLGALEPGIAAVNLGTSAMMRTGVRRPVVDASGAMRLSTIPLVPGLWLTGAGVNNAGNAIEWFMETFGVRGYAQLDRLVRRAGAGEDAPVAFPFLTAERDPRLAALDGAAFTGLRPHHRLPEMALALLEGIACSLRLIRDALRENGVPVREIRAGGGGTNLPSWMEIIAGVLGSPVRGTCSGGAVLAGSAALALAALGRNGSLRGAARPLAAAGRAVVSRGKAGGRDARFRLFVQGLPRAAG